MRYLFLDIDGVLNSHGWWRRRNIDAQLKEADTFDRSWRPEDKEKARFIRSLIDLDPEACAMFNLWVKELDLQIVVSSTWRLSRTLDELKALLSAKGIDPSRIIAKTPRLNPDDVPSVDGVRVKRSSCWRGLEIENWIWNEHPTSEERDKLEIIILDDDSDFSRLTPWHVQTSLKTGGLLQGHRSEIVRALNLPLEGVLDKPHVLFRGSVPALLV